MLYLRKSQRAAHAAKFQGSRRTGYVSNVKVQVKDMRIAERERGEVISRRVKGGEGKLKVGDDSFEGYNAREERARRRR